MRVSQKVIAKQAGVDKSTVSLALRDHPSISADTRARIKGIAESLGYRPDPALALIARHRWGTDKDMPTQVLAFVMTPEAISQRVPQKKLIEPAQQRARQRGYDLQLFNFGDYPTGDALSRVLFHRGIRGLLLAPLPQIEGPMSLRLQWDKFTTVSCMLGWSRPPLHVVEFDWFQAIRRGWAEVLARGYKRIGAALFSHEKPSENDMAALGAVRAEQSRLPRTHRVIPPYEGDLRDPDGFKTWYRRYSPDVVLGFNDAPLMWLKAMGIGVPLKVGFLSLSAEGTGVSGMVRSHSVIAAAGVDMLVAKLLEFEQGIPKVQQTLLIEPQWVEGTTIRPVER
jgi:DNA-binding LacI/PurR family transcriptional regulator